MSVDLTPTKPTRFAPTRTRDDAFSPSPDPFNDALTPATTRGRKPRKRRKRTPTPPFDLPPHEQYFWQHRPGRQLPGSSGRQQLPRIDHETFFDSISHYIDPNVSAYTELHDIHARSFAQWYFELSESYSVCLYGYGSKRRLVADFAHYLHLRGCKIFILNAYCTSLDLRRALSALATLISGDSEDEGAQIPALLAKISEYTHPPVYLFINSLDASPLRRPLSNMNIVAQLATCRSVRILATCDTMNFALLWPSELRDKLRWVFHDTTTFISFGGVEIATVVDDVNELLGRTLRRVKGKEGVGFVLKSLPGNARNLYRMLLKDLLNRDDLDETRQADNVGSIDSRMLYQRATEDFICSHETGYRQLLKEFFDHDMLTTRRDFAAGGIEVLTVPFRRDECDLILAELDES